ncbi:MAG: hypothetical protein KDA41_16090 [Planctomycetales bacterium]|nr:hypothetical protein [Planctomycetales bacterium]
MNSRWYSVAVVACWLASMCWLVTAKVLPTLREGSRPTYDAMLPEAEAAKQTTAWDIFLRDEHVGRAVSVSTRLPDGSGKLESDVHFERLPLGQIAMELLGSFGTVLRQFWGADDDLKVDLDIVSEMSIGPTGKLDSFVTRVGFAGVEDWLQVRGTVLKGQLEVSVYEVERDDAGAETLRLRFQDHFPLTDDSLVGGALSPQERLTGLHVGQTWTFPVYRPFPPNSPVQMVEATVERYEWFEWNGQTTRAYHVVYRDEAGSGLSIAQEPIARLWVGGDGSVLRQEGRIADLTVSFVRLPDEAAAER